ncbi:12109_t:CDS:2 [Funneliformis mosseae]|uniref:12109_t:CDS:1 n=1 Tax=Funneliformis mosseae TaxID=27381 RepID=A0A9N9B4A1_FUNMO|nr:12109_t:CDS:2 [Funneliformis mosseae]
MAPHNFENEASTTRFWIDIERNLQIFNVSLFKRLALMFGSKTTNTLDLKALRNLLIVLKNCFNSEHDKKFNKLLRVIGLYTILCLVIISPEVNDDSCGENAINKKHSKKHSKNHEYA